MPEPDSPDTEILHELRRKEMDRIFSRTVRNNQPKNKHQMAEPNSISQNKSLESSKSKSLDSNLSKDELMGLASLKKRISEGSLVVADTDKSKKFALLTREQYLESGLQHTVNDLEILPDNVKRIQNVVNDHVRWVKEITNIGKKCWSGR